MFKISTLPHAVLAFGLLVTAGAPAFAQGEAPQGGGTINLPITPQYASPIRFMTPLHATSYQGPMSAPAGTSSGLTGSMTGPGSPSTNAQGTPNSGPVGTAPNGGSGQ